MHSLLDIPAMKSQHDVIALYMGCTVDIDMSMFGFGLVGTIEFPIQDTVAEALKHGGRWMFEDGVMI